MARYTIDLSPEFVDVLDKLASSKHATKAEILRRAVASYSFLDKQVDSQTGTKVSITTKDDKVIKDVVLP
jgi:predicted transcriptional regulator